MYSRIGTVYLYSHRIIYRRTLVIHHCNMKDQRQLWKVNYILAPFANHMRVTTSVQYTICFYFLSFTDQAVYHTHGSIWLLLLCHWLRLYTA